ncbi:MAG: hypothetical protein ACOZCO_09310 [Bacteroidota bacterium]
MHNRRIVIVYVTAAFFMAACGNNNEQKKEDTDTTKITSDELPMPAKENLGVFADSLFSRGIINEDTLQLIRLDIEKGKINHGAFDFLPYLKSATIIGMDSLEKVKQPEKYMRDIYNEMIALIPGFVPDSSVVIKHAYTPEPGVLGKAWEEKRKNYIPVMLSEMPEEKVYGHVWYAQLHDNYSGEYYDISFRAEWEIADIINQQLDQQRSDYRIVQVHPYNKKGQMVPGKEQKFGVVVLSKKQGDYLYVTDGTHDGAWIFPSLDMSAYYAEYLSADSIAEIIEECKNLGLLKHLPAATINKISKESIHKPMLTPYEVLSSFPGGGQEIVWDRSEDTTWTATLKRLAEISGGKFNPVNIRESKAHSYSYDNSIILSFSLNGRTYWENVPDGLGEWEEYNFLTWLNVSLAKAGIDGKFYETDQSDDVFFLTQNQIDRAEEMSLFYFFEPSPPPEED